MAKEKIALVVENNEGARAKESLAKIVDFLTAAPITGAAVYDPPEEIEYGRDVWEEVYFRLHLGGERTLEGRYDGALDEWVLRLESREDFHAVEVPKDVFFSLDQLAKELIQRWEDTYHTTLAHSWAGLKLEISEAGDE